jgi:hypothetical protein
MSQVETGICEQPPDVITGIVFGVNFTCASPAVGETGVVVDQ